LTPAIVGKRLAPCRAGTARERYRSVARNRLPRAGYVREPAERTQSRMDEGALVLDGDRVAKQVGDERVY
jgi:hypothetical protein